MKPESRLALNATFISVASGAIVGTVLDTLLVMARYSPPAGAEPPNFFLATLATFIGSLLFYGLGGLILFPLQTFALFSIYVKKFRCAGRNLACLVPAGLVIAAAAFAPVFFLLQAMFPQNIVPSIIPVTTGVAAGLWYLSRPRLPSIAVVAALLLFLLPRPLRAAPPIIIEPGVKAGPISIRSSEASLRKEIGTDFVQSAPVGVGEGEQRSGTVLFPDDPIRRVEILWKDDETKERPETVFVRGEASVWRTSEYITIGTDLAEVERLNGKPFHLTGFDWDYSGSLTDGNGGELAYLGVDGGDSGIEGRTLMVRFTYAEDKWKALSAAERKSVSGDKILESDNPVMKKLNPTIYEMVVSFP